MKLSTVPHMLLVIALALCARAAESPGKVYGTGVSIEQATAISALLAAPQDYAGKSIRIDGVVTEVCPVHGDWLKVSGPRAGSGILVRVAGAAIAFPADCVGRRVSVQGVFEAVLDRSETAAGEAPEGAHAPHVCRAMTRGGKRYQLRVTGAVVR
jgi:hypothetical protein